MKFYDRKQLELKRAQGKIKLLPCFFLSQKVVVAAFFVKHSIFIYEIRFYFTHFAL